MQNVMVVSINYRLGVYGFLYHSDDTEEYNGNWGLLDQQAAMEWTNIFAPHFGGDTSSITLTCCSAGCKA